jgi:hypothetical protein
MSAQQQGRIFRYIFSLLALIVIAQGAVCQQNKDTKSHEKPSPNKGIKKKSEPQPLLRAVTVQADVAGTVISKMGTSGVTYAEASIDVNLRNRWFPVWEIGYASINHIVDEGGHFIAKGVYNRIGFNVNLLKMSDPKQIASSIFYVGLRFGFAPFRYDLHNLPLTDEYWSPQTTAITNLDNLKASAKWGEIVTGIRLTIFKNISLGWSGRLKLGLSTGKGDYSPWYVPGYGINDGTAWGFTYSIGYTIPLRSLGGEKGKK